MTKEKNVGIYCIENIINGKKYIGQSCDLAKRLSEHKRRLNCRDVHENRYLQRAWDKYGENSFSFNILEYCNESSLDEREIYWIAHYNSSCDKNGYNAELGGSKGEKRLSQTLKEQISATLKEQRNTEEYRITHSGKNNPMSKPCICVNTQQVFDCAKDAAREMGVGYDGVIDCCNNKIPECRGLQWQYYEDGKVYELKSVIKKQRQRNKRQKQIVQFDVSFNQIGIFCSSYEIVEKYHPEWNRKCIVATCSGSEPTYKGYIFMYKDDIISAKTKDEIKAIRETSLLTHAHYTRTKKNLIKVG